MTDITSVDDTRGMLGTEVVKAFRAVQAERDAWHRRFSEIFKEHHQFMNDMLAATDVEIDEDGPYILDQIVTAARKTREDRDEAQAMVVDAVMLHQETIKERDALAVALAELRAGLKALVLHVAPDPDREPRGMAETIARGLEPMLAQPAPERGVALLARLAALEEALLHVLSVRQADPKCDVCQQAVRLLPGVQQSASDGQRGGGG